MRAAFILLVLLCFISLPKSQVTGHFPLVPPVQRALWAESFDGDNARHTHEHTHFIYSAWAWDGKANVTPINCQSHLRPEGCVQTHCNQYDERRQITSLGVYLMFISIHTFSHMKKDKENARSAVKNGLKAWHCGKTERLRVSGEHLLSAPPG